MFLEQFSVFAPDQSSSRLHKTVIDYYDNYFEFMKEAYDYISILKVGLRLHLDYD